jgi:hypothetical protein
MKRRDFIAGLGSVPVASPFATRAQQPVQLAESYAVPTCYECREFVTAGGLMSYGASNTDIWRQVGVYRVAF